MSQVRVLLGEPSRRRQALRSFSSLSDARLTGLAALVGVGLAAAPAARAQVGASVTLMSDYRYRGFSLSDGRPALSVSLGYDHPSGLYGEVSGFATTTAKNGVQVAGYQAFAGYAQRLSSGASWDVGALGAELTQYFQPHYRVRYAEVYGGVSLRNFSAHLYYSPDYLGEDVQTLYASLDASSAPAPDWRLFAHAGVLAPVGLSRQSEIRKAQYDLSAGAAVRIKALELKAAVSTLGPDADYPGSHRQSRSALVVSAAYAF